MVHFTYNSFKRSIVKSNPIKTGRIFMLPIFFVLLGACQCLHWPFLLIYQNASPRARGAYAHRVVRGGSGPRHRGPSTRAPPYSPHQPPFFGPMHSRPMGPPSYPPGPRPHMHRGMPYTRPQRGVPRGRGRGLGRGRGSPARGANSNQIFRSHPTARPSAGMNLFLSMYFWQIYMYLAKTFICYRRHYLEVLGCKCAFYKIYNFLWL